MSYTPTQTLTKNTVTGNWELNENGTDRTYVNTLNTDNKVVSGDIKLNIAARSATVSTPTISQSTVVDNQIVFTPSIEITDAGWVDNGTITGESITIGASDLVSGSTLVTKYGPGWYPKTWNLENIKGQCIWVDGDNVYYSYGSTQKVLNKSTGEWEDKTWYFGDYGAKFSDNGNNIWSDTDGNFYSSSGTQQYYLVKETNTWYNKTWDVDYNVSHTAIWTDGTNTYYSAGSTQKVLNKSTKQWEDKSWSGLNSFNGNNIWTDGTNIYYSEYSGVGATIQKVLNGNTWEDKTWSGLSNFSGYNVWTDGTNIYYSGSTYLPKGEYVLNKSNSTWTSIDWKGYRNAGDIDGFYIWTDGTNIYYSYYEYDESRQYILYLNGDNNIYTDVTNYQYAYVQTEEATVTPTKSIQTIIPSAIENFLERVIVDSIPQEYIIPTGTLTPTSSGIKDVTNYKRVNIREATVNSPTINQTKSVTQIDLVPKVNISQSGWVNAGTLTGDTLTLVIGDLTDGTITLTQQSGTDVGIYRYADVISGSATASATKGSVSNHKITVTPKVTKTYGWIDSGTVSGTAVTVSASELVSGSMTITENEDSIDVTNLQYVNVNVPQGITPTGTITITQQSGTNVSTYSYADVQEGNAPVATSLSGSNATVSLSGTAITLTKVVTNSGSTFTKGWIETKPSGSTTITLSGVVPTETKTITPTTTAQTITPSAGKLISSVKVNAITVGTAGTPIATKGTVSNHKMIITPEVTNVEGYISSETITGSGVEVAASELVSGSQSITVNGTSINVTNLQYVDVDVSAGAVVSGTATLTKQIGTDVTNYKDADVRSATVSAQLNSTISSSLHKAEITPVISVTQSGWVESGSTGSVMTITAGDLVSGALDITDNANSITVTNVQYVNVNVPKGITPTGTITITQQTGTNVTDYATADVRGATVTPNITYTTEDGWISIIPQASLSQSGWVDSISNGSEVLVNVSALCDGTITLTQQTGTTVTGYKFADVQEASGFLLSVQDNTNVVNVGTVSSGYYPLTATVTATLVAGQFGWFAAASATDSSVQVGKIKAGTITNNTSGGSSSGTINRGSQIKIDQGYYSATVYYTAQSNSGTMPTTITANGTYGCNGYAYVKVAIPTWSGTYS